MEKIKNFESYYYNDNGKIYQQDDIENAPESFWNSNPSYIPDHLEDFIPELTNIKNKLVEIQNKLEDYGPIDDDIVDAVDSISKILDKWENTPINKATKKYNL